MLPLYLNLVFYQKTSLESHVLERDYKTLSKVDIEWLVD